MRCALSLSTTHIPTAYSTAAQVCACTKEPADFDDTWKAKVVADTGAHYLKPRATSKGAALATWKADQHVSPGAYEHGRPTRSKLSIRGVAA